MPQRFVVRFTDDLIGAWIPAGKGETVTFSLDGASFEIDLAAKNATALREVVRPCGRTWRPVA